MMERLPDDLTRVWNQKRVPVVFRSGRKGSKLAIRLPFATGNRQWLQNGKRITPDWRGDRQCWQTPVAWFNEFVERALARYGKLYVIQPYREQEKCSPACLNATGHECQCSCMGANHGAGNDGSWFEVTDTFATRWGERRYASRLMRSKG